MFLLFGGALHQTFSVLRGLEDVNDYHVFRGCYVNTFSIEIPKAGLISMAFGLMALGRTNFSAPPAGAVTPADNSLKLSNVFVGEILIDGVFQAGISCLTAFSFKWDNTMKLRNVLAKELMPERF